MQNKKSGGHMLVPLETITVMALCTVDALMTKWTCKLPLLHHIDNQDCLGAMCGPIGCEVGRIHLLQCGDHLPYSSDCLGA